MFVCDMKDFRKGVQYPITLDEDSIREVLEEAGVEWDEPFDLKVRLKDTDIRGLLTKFDMVGENGEAFRLNVYLPPFLPDTVYCTNLTYSARHNLKHIAQIRMVKGQSPENPDVVKVWENDAQEFAKANNGTLLIDHA